MKSCLTFLILFIMVASCKKKVEAPASTSAPATSTIDYRHEMRQFVVHLAQYARQFNNNFIVIPQNGHQLCTINGNPDGALAIDYMSTINGQGREELFYGYDNNDDVATPIAERLQWLPFLERMRNAGVKILVTDYCTSHTLVDDSYAQNNSLQFISFAADARDLNTLPSYPSSPFEENNANITSINDARNFLYLINTDQYNDKASLISALLVINYDIIIIDAFFEDESFTQAEIAQLKIKANGANRKVIAYMSIGEAEDYRYYWLPYWSFNTPAWMGALNSDWPGNFKVQYWNSDWQHIIFGNDESYTKKIVDSGFDGVYLDIIDAFEYWEEQ